MGTLTIRNLDEPLKARLRIRAAERNRSMEEEARQILRAALQEPQLPVSDLATRIRARFAALGNVELAIAPREQMRPELDLGAPEPSLPAADARTSRARS
jgi:plasmid stability protein